jgi:glycosyltransferase 2 family protein
MIESANQPVERAMGAVENNCALKVPPNLPEAAAKSQQGNPARDRQPSQPRFGKTRGSWLLLLLVSICLSLAVPFFLGGWSQFRLLQLLSWWAAVLFTALMLLSWACNAWRTHLLVKAMGRGIAFREAVTITMAAEFAGVTTPGAVGMVPAYSFFFHNLGLSVGQSVGVVGLIVVTDLAFYGTLMPAAAILQFFESGAKHDVLSMVFFVFIVVIGAAILLGALVRHYRRVCSFMGRQMAKVSWLARRRWRLARSTVQCIRALRILQGMSWTQRIKLYLVTFCFWLPRYLILVLLLYLLGVQVPLAYQFLIQGVLNLGGQAFLTPGGGGTVDAGYAALMSYYLDAQAIAFTLLVWRTFTFYWYLVVGGPVFLYKAGTAARHLLSNQPRPI